MKFTWKDGDGKSHLTDDAFNAIMFTLWWSMICGTLITCAYLLG